MVGGSDSHEEFQNICKPTCKKKCVHICKNAHRRIKIYRYFVDKNFDELCMDFIFFGSNSQDSKGLVQYIPYRDYDRILVYKKK